MAANVANADACSSGLTPRARPPRAIAHRGGVTSSGRMPARCATFCTAGGPTRVISWANTTLIEWAKASSTFLSPPPSPSKLRTSHLSAWQSSVIGESDGSIDRGSMPASSAAR